MTNPPKARPCMLRLSGETTGRQQSGAIRRNQTQSDDRQTAIRRNQAQSGAIRRPADSNQAQSDAIRRNQVQSGAIRRNQTQSERIHTCRGRRRSPLDASASQPHRGDQAWALANPWQRRRHGAAGARTAEGGMGEGGGERGGVMVVITHKRGHQRGHQRGHHHAPPSPPSSGGVRRRPIACVSSSRSPRRGLVAPCERVV